MKYDAADFYDEPRTKIDKPDSGNWIGIAIVFALSGFVAGIVITRIVMGWLYAF